MMKTNFSLPYNSGIHFQGRDIDLHNCFEFVELKEHFPEKAVTIKFEKLNESWVRDDEFDTISFKLKGITFYHKSSSADNEYLENAKTLEFITFFSPELRDINNSLVLKEYPDENDDILFHFVNEDIIRVACGEVEVMTQ